MHAAPVRQARSNASAGWRAVRTGLAVLGGLTLTAVTPAAVLGAGQAAGGVLEFAPQFYRSAFNESGVTNLVVTRTGGTDGPLAAQVVVTGGSATPDVDYTFSPVLVTFADGDASPKLVPVTIVDDVLIEPEETVVVALVSQGPETRLGEAHVGVVAIQSNDSLNLPRFYARLTVTAPTSVDPSGALGTYTTTRTTIRVSGGASGFSGTVLDGVGWTSDRGYQGSAGTNFNEPEPFPPVWATGEIPLLAGANTLTFTMYSGDVLRGSIVLIVMVPRYEYVFSEGAAGSFFDTEIAVFNPTSRPAPITVRHLTSGAGDVPVLDTIAPEARRVYGTAGVAGLDRPDGFATAVTSHDAVPLAVERTMRWDRGGYGSHAAVAADGASLTWYFAEGAQGFFHTFLLLGNPDAQENHVSIDWLREGQGVLTTRYTLPARSRTTIYAGAVPGLVNSSFGSVVTFERPAVAERAMYFGDVPLFKGGHASVGAREPSRTWYLAEGATGSFFETFLLLMNPNPVAVAATVTFLTDGPPIERQVAIAPVGRVTMDVDAIVDRSAVAIQVTCPSAIVAERSQYWPGPPDTWYEGHNGFGSVELATRWGLADGRTGGADRFQTFVLFMNPWEDPATVDVTFFREDAAPLIRRVAVPARSRMNLSLAGSATGSDAPEMDATRFSALVVSDRPIAVERSVYSSVPGRVFITGTHATATRLP